MQERLKRWSRRAMNAIWLSLPAAICGCGSTPQLPLRVPPLPLEARQPEIPSECSPTCLAALTKERASWLTTQTVPASPGLPASAPMTR